MIYRAIYKQIIIHTSLRSCTYAEINIHVQNHTYLPAFLHVCRDKYTVTKSYIPACVHVVDNTRLLILVYNGNKSVTSNVTKCKSDISPPVKHPNFVSKYQPTLMISCMHNPVTPYTYFHDVKLICMTLR